MFDYWRWSLTVFFLNQSFLCFCLSFVQLTLWLVDTPHLFLPIVETKPNDTSIKRENGATSATENALAQHNDNDIAKAFDFYECGPWGGLRELYKFGGLRNGLFRGFRHTCFPALLAVIFYFLFGCGLSPFPNLLHIDFWSTLPIHVVTIVVLAPLHAAATHSIVAAKPTGFFKRFPPFTTWKHLMLPAAVLAVVYTLWITVLFTAFSLILIPTITDADENSLHMDYSLSNRRTIGLRVLLSTASKLSACLATGHLLAFAILPVAAFTLVRTHICLLPPDEETIVPVDRSCGGLATPILVKRGNNDHVELFVLEPAAAYNGWAARAKRCLRKMCKLSRALSLLVVSALVAAMSLWILDPMLLCALLGPYTPGWMMAEAMRTAELRASLAAEQESPSIG